MLSLWLINLLLRYQISLAIKSVLTSTHDSDSSTCKQEALMPHYLKSCWNKSSVDTESTRVVYSKYAFEYVLQIHSPRIVIWYVDFIKDSYQLKYRKGLFIQRGLLGIYGSWITFPWHVQKSYFYSWYGVRTLQVA